MNIKKSTTKQKKKILKFKKITKSEWDSLSFVSQAQVFNELKIDKKVFVDIFLRVAANLNAVYLNKLKSCSNLTVKDIEEKENTLKNNVKLLELYTNEPVKYETFQKMHKICWHDYILNNDIISKIFSNIFKFLMVKSRHYKIPSLESILSDTCNVYGTNFYTDISMELWKFIKQRQIDLIQLTLDDLVNTIDT